MSTTPVGDYLRKRYPPNPGATHYLGSGDDPGCCAGPHPSCTYRAAWREALLSLAAELDRMAGEWRDGKLPVGACALGDAARLARERAGEQP